MAPLLKAKLACLVIMVALCLIVSANQAFGCNSSHNSLCSNVASNGPLKIDSRKLLAGLKSNGFTGTNKKTLEQNLLVRHELRVVPSGPDPLHHNGGSTKKPRATP